MAKCVKVFVVIVAIVVCLCTADSEKGSQNSNNEEGETSTTGKKLVTSTTVNKVGTTTASIILGTNVNKGEPSTYIAQTLNNPPQEGGVIQEIVTDFGIQSRGINPEVINVGTPTEKQAKPQIIPNGKSGYNQPINNGPNWFSINTPFSYQQPSVYPSMSWPGINMNRPFPVWFQKYILRWMAGYMHQTMWRNYYNYMELEYYKKLLREQYVTTIGKSQQRTTPSPSNEDDSPSTTSSPNKFGDSPRSTSNPTIDDDSATTTSNPSNKEGNKSTTESAKNEDDRR